MNTERWKQIDELFDAVLDLSETERERFLSEKCAGDDELKNKVLTLLKATTTGDFLEKSAMGIVARNLAEEQTIVIERQFIGRMLETFRLERQIGAGGMGEVYLATDEKLKRKVALKILPAEYTSSDERVKRFELEAHAISALNHPNIVTIHDVGTASGINYIATEYVEGKTLRELIGEKLALAEILNIMMQVCDALAAAHAAGIIHRDIKPENIMVRPDGYAKILDFGLVKLNANETQALNNFTKTAKGIIIGTPAYMSPGQVTGDNVDHRTDLWSVGVVLYELLTGSNPYKKETRQATFQSILLDEPPLASTINAEVSGELDRILYKALEKDPDITYQTAADLRADLRRVRREIDSSAGSLSTQKRKFAGTRRRSLVFASLLVLLAVGAGVFFFALYGWRTTPVDWGKAQTVQLTDQSGAEIFPTLSPDGKTFIFAAKSARGDFDLFLQRVGDKRARNITEDCLDNDTMPAFSPDGERVAFRSGRDGTEGIYLMSAGGENVRRVTDFGYHPAWSPDGKELAVSTKGRMLPDVRSSTLSEIFIINVETGAKRLLIGADAMQPAWSPDGKFIAYWFYQQNAGRRDIGVVSANGGEPQIITKDGTTNWNPVWSPDGKFIYFASDRFGTMKFWRAAFKEGQYEFEPEAVVTSSKYSRHLAFSRDGSRMIYVSTDNKSNLQAVAFDPVAEKTVGEPYWITSGDRRISRPQLSPDGTQFVFCLSRLTQDDIVIMNRDGTNMRDLTNDASFDRYPRWSPDGKRVVFASDRSGMYEIWTIEADGTNLRQITFTGKPGTSFPHWSPDGKRLLYRSERQNYIIDPKKPIAEQTPQMVPEAEPVEGRRFVIWDWSPDGARLVGSLSGGPMKAGAYSIAENRFDILGDTDVYPVAFPDQRRIIWGFENRLYIGDTVTKRTSELGIRTTDTIQDVGVSRDGKMIYYTLFSSESDIWLLDNSANQ